MNNTLLLFDVDGTLVDSGGKISLHMSTTLNRMRAKGYDLGIAGGGSLSKILVQMQDAVIFDHYFSECGCVYNKYDETSYDLIEVYCKNLRDHPTYPSINLLMKKAMKFISNVEYTITGNFIDLRKGIVYISLIGMSATEEEREYFKAYDKKHGVRKELVKVLSNECAKMGMQNRVSVVEGGSVGVAIFPVECDKIQVLPFLTQYDTIHYFGDKYLEDGNDHQLLHANGVIGHMVDCKEDTHKLLKKMLDDSC